MSFASESYGWIVGDYGKVLGTDDGGLSWIQQGSSTVPSSVNLKCVYAVTEHLVWAVGSAGAILHTSDGGQSWAFQSSAIASDTLYGVHFVNETHGWICGQNGKYLFTTNGGSRWYQVITALNSGRGGGGEALRAVYFTEHGTGFMVGDSGKLLRSENGTDWLEWPSCTEHALLDITVDVSGYGWSVGAFETVCYTDDGGKTWKGMLAEVYLWARPLTVVEIEIKAKGWNTNPGLDGAMLAYYP
eukprot:gene23025-27860_t